MSDPGQLFPSSSLPDGTDYGTSGLDLIAWRQNDDASETRVYEAGEVGLLYISGTTVHHGVSTKQSI